MATVPSLVGFTVGERVTAAKLTGHTKTAVDFLIAPPACRLAATAVQSFGNFVGTYTTVNLPSSVFDTDTMADTANNQIVIKTAGKYRINGAVSYATNGTGGRIAGISVNAASPPSLVSISSAPSGISAVAQVDGVLQLAVNDTLRLFGGQTSGGSLNSSYAGGGGFVPTLSAVWIST